MEGHRRRPQTKVVLVTGAGRAFSVGGDNNMLAHTLGDAEKIAGLWREAGDIVYNMINLDKPIISAINGPGLRRRTGGGAGRRYQHRRRKTSASPTVTSSSVWQPATMP